jgi:hypothetical protein
MPSSRLILSRESTGCSSSLTKRISAEWGSLYSAKAFIWDFVSIFICKDTPFFCMGDFKHCQTLILLPEIIEKSVIVRFLKENDAE